MALQGGAALRRWHLHWDARCLELAGAENNHPGGEGFQQRSGFCMEWPLVSLGWKVLPVVPCQVGCQATSSQPSVNWLPWLTVTDQQRCQDCWLVQLEQPGFVAPEAQPAVVGAAQPHPKPGGQRRVKRILLQPMHRLKGVRAAVYNLWSLKKIHKKNFLRFYSIQPVLEIRLVWRISVLGRIAPWMMGLTLKPYPTKSRGAFQVRVEQLEDSI